jgi:DNA-directed RNA polymerase sigma subunit (sigma70/sigma32)
MSIRKQYQEYLKRRDRSIIRMRAGGMTYTAIGIAYDLTRERVRQIITANVAQKKRRRK